MKWAIVQTTNTATGSIDPVGSERIDVLRVIASADGNTTLTFQSSGSSGLTTLAGPIFLAGNDPKQWGYVHGSIMPSTSPGEKLTVSGSGGNNATLTIGYRTFP